MIKGQLYRFSRYSAWMTASRPGRLEDKHAIYLGEDFIHREDGVTIENHKILVVGESKPTTIDRGLLKYMEAVNESR